MMLWEECRNCAAGDPAVCESCRFRGEADCSGALLEEAATALLVKPTGELTANAYQKEAMRTAATLKRKSDRLINGLMGLCGESGECMEILKKHLFQGRELDRKKLAEELGDVAWYLALSADAIDMPLEQILRLNVEKLRRRYPEGFKPEWYMALSADAIDMPLEQILRLNVEELRRRYPEGFEPERSIHREEEVTG